MKKIHFLVLVIGFLFIVRSMVAGSDVNESTPDRSFSDFANTSNIKVNHPAENKDFGFRVATFRDDKDCAISYTFDDALVEQATLVAPKMEKLGFRGTFWVNGKTIEDDKPGSEKPRANWDQLRKMAHKGHEVSNHGWAHKNFNRLTIPQMKEEIAKNDSAIFLHTGVMPLTFCYPFNAKNDSAIALASANRIATRTEQFSVGGKSTAESLEKRVMDLIQNKEWGVTMTHGINVGYDHFTDSQIFWDHLEKVKKQEGQIWVGTFRDVAAYVKARKSLKYSIAETAKGFVVRPEIQLDPKLFTVPLTGVIDRSVINKVSVVQQNKKLKTHILKDKILFDFNPFGGDIIVTIK